MDEGVVLNLAAILAVGDMAEVRAEVLHIAERVAEAARTKAPRGDRNHSHGADSIRAEASVELGEWSARVSWDQLHWYMRFPEMGARGPHGQPAQHFLRDAADHYAR